MDNETKKLYRLKLDRKIAGVCGGIGKFINVDSNLIRLLWILFCLAGGSGIIVYIAAALLIPEEPTM